jgi:hypothetical protein
MQQILSVSRRTDIPAFYMSWFMDQVASGSITVINPFNQKARQVEVSPRRVHTLVFWSKNFGPFLDGGYGERLQELGYHLFFNFTVNSRNKLLEPEVPSLDRRLDQLQQLSEHFGAETIQWRFDPICHYRTREGLSANNLSDFKAIARTAGACGIGVCITSFMDHYRKIDRRTRDRLGFVEPPITEKVAILTNMEETLAPLGIQLALCCEKKVLQALPENSTIGPAACISAGRMMAVHGGRLSLRRDAGQRQAAGCCCTVSVDVGSYTLHPCHHNCVFCYANPACDGR